MKIVLVNKFKAFANRSTNSKLDFSLLPHTGTSDDVFKRRNINFHWCDFKKRLFLVNNDTTAHRDEQALKPVCMHLFILFFYRFASYFSSIFTAFLSSHKSRRGSFAQHKKGWHMWWFVHNFFPHITILNTTLHDKSVNAEWKALLNAAGRQPTSTSFLRGNEKRRGGKPTKNFFHLISFFSQ